MKLADAMKAIAKQKEQQLSTPVVEVVVASRGAKRSLNHHRGVIHAMGIASDSAEYEEMSQDLDELSTSNPTLYHKIINMD